MSESEATETDVAAVAGPTGVEDVSKAERKRARNRKKQIFERILKQMEFYFSDANLTKDRYLGELSRADPSVPLQIFLKFNKIRALTNNINDIAKAIQGSELIECVDNIKVRRKVPLESYDAESRTVYVESVPSMVDRDWLETVFSDYGHVAYISLPKFKNSNKNKGFAFIEFKTSEEAQKCLAAFSKMGCKLPTSMSPEELITIKTFSAEHSSEEPNNKSSTCDSKSRKVKKEESEDNELIPSETDSEKHKLDMSKSEKAKRHLGSVKRKAKFDDESKTENLKKETEPPSKKVKTDSESEVEHVNCPKSSVNAINTDGENKSDTARETVSKDNNTKKQDRKRTREKRNKKKKELSVEDKNDKNVSVQSEQTVERCNKEKEEHTDASSQEDCKKTDEVAKKRIRKRTAKERSKAKNKKSKFGLPEGAILGLQVLSKTEWRILRNKYLNLQRKQMKELKNNLRMQGVYHAPVNVEKKTPTEEEKKASEAGAVNKLLKANGVFVKVELPEPCLQVRLTKRQVRSNIHVQHVNVKEGQTEMIIRFDTPESAQQYCSSGIYASSRVLLGAESEAEWARVEAEREAAGPRRPRGRQRLLERAVSVSTNLPALPDVQPTPSHVRFDD